MADKRPRPRETLGRNIAFRIYNEGSEGGVTKGYLTVGEYEDGSLCEIFLRVAKHGSTMDGFADWVAILMSEALQAGAPLFELCRVAAHQKYPPYGTTDDPEIPYALSIASYVTRRLALNYLSEQELEALAIPERRKHEG